MRQVPASSSLLFLQRRAPSQGPQVPHALPSRSHPSTRLTTTSSHQGMAAPKPRGLPFGVPDVSAVHRSGRPVSTSRLLGVVHSTTTPRSRLLSRLDKLAIRLVHYRRTPRATPSVDAKPSSPCQCLPQVPVPDHARRETGPAAAGLPPAGALVSPTLRFHCRSMRGHAHPTEAGRCSTGSRGGFRASQPRRTSYVVGRRTPG